MIGSQFCNVGGESGVISLDNLIPVAAEGVDTSSSVIIQVLDEAGYTTEDDFTWDGTQWTDTNTGAPVKGKTFDIEKGLWVYNFTGEEVQLQSSGQVVTSDINAPLSVEYGAVAVVNCFPTPVALSDLLPIPGNAEVDISSSIIIQILDDAGYTTDADYTWDGSKWVDTNTGAVVENVTFDAGQGLWVYNFTGEAVSLRIPAPEL